MEESKERGAVFAFSSLARLDLSPVLDIHRPQRRGHIVRSDRTIRVHFYSFHLRTNKTIAPSTPAPSSPLPSPRPP
jgi:hypothetical protein